MAKTPYFLPHLHPHCTGAWQITPFAKYTLWRCPECHATYPDAGWVREAAAREIWSGEQIQRLANEGQRLLGDAGWGGA